MRADRALSSEGNGDGNDAVLGVCSLGSFGRVVVVAAILSWSTEGANVLKSRKRMARDERRDKMRDAGHLGANRGSDP